MVLQASEDDYRSGGHDKDTLGPHGTQRLECWSLQTALYIGDRPMTRRRLGGFSLLSTIRCQTSWISPSAENVTIYLLLWHLETGQQSTRKTRGPSWSTLWYDWLQYPTWNRPNVSTGALENPLGILLTGHMGISRGPQTLCPLCFDKTGNTTRGLQQTFAEGRTAYCPCPCC